MCRCSPRAPDIEENLRDLVSQGRQRPVEKPARVRNAKLSRAMGCHGQWDLILCWHFRRVDKRPSCPNTAFTSLFLLEIVWGGNEAFPRQSRAVFGSLGGRARNTWPLDRSRGFENHNYVHGCGARRAPDATEERPRKRRPKHPKDAPERGRDSRAALQPRHAAALQPSPLNRGSGCARQQCLAFNRYIVTEPSHAREGGKEG